MNVLEQPAFGIQYHGETLEEYRERERRARINNHRVRLEHMRWQKWAMRSLWPWCERRAPELVPPWSGADSYEDWAEQEMKKFIQELDK